MIGHGPILKNSLAIFARGKNMAKKRVFISFDYDNDARLKDFLVGQSRLADSPFDFIDCSVKEHLTGNWKEKARVKIRGADVVAVICGDYTDRAVGVSAEVNLAQEERVPYFLLNGYADRTCRKPMAANDYDKIYKWTWDNLKALINGAR